MSKFLWGMGLKGVGDGATTFGNMQAAGVLQQERLREARALEDLRQEGALDRAELRAGRSGSRSSGSSGGGGAGVLAGEALAPEGMTAAQFAARTGMDLPEANKFIGSFKSGDWSPYEQEYVGEGSGPKDENFKDMAGPGEPTNFKGLPPSFAEFKKRKLAELSGVLDENAFGKDYKNVTEGRQAAQVVKNVGEYEAGGGEGALNAALAGQGKDPRETDAKAAKAQAEADKAARTDPNLRGTGRGGGGSGSGSTRALATNVDADGYVYSVSPDGKNIFYPRDEKGNKVKRDNFEKRVDAMAVILSKQPQFFNSTPDEIRSAATSAIAASGGAAAAPAAAPKKAPDQAAGAKVKADFKAGKITRADAVAKLKALGFD